MVLFLGLIDLPHTHIRMVFQKVSNMGCKPSIVAPEAAPDRMLFKESFPLAMVS